MLYKEKQKKNKNIELGPLINDFYEKENRFLISEIFFFKFKSTNATEVTL